MILCCYIASAVGASKPRASGDDPFGDSYGYALIP